LGTSSSFIAHLRRLFDCACVVLFLIWLLWNIIFILFSLLWLLLLFWILWRGFIVYFILFFPVWRSLAWLFRYVLLSLHFLMARSGYAALFNLCWHYFLFPLHNLVGLLAVTLMINRLLILLLVHLTRFLLLSFRVFSLF
jgi:hypothetical protein